MSFLSIYDGASGVNKLEEKINKELKEGAESVLGFGLGYTDDANRAGLLVIQDTNDNIPYRVRLFSNASLDQLESDVNSWLDGADAPEPRGVSITYGSDKTRVMILYLEGGGRGITFQSVFLESSDSGGIREKVQEVADNSNRVWTVAYTAGGGKNRACMIVTP